MRNVNVTDKEKKWMHSLLHSSKIFSTCAKRQYDECGIEVATVSTTELFKGVRL